MAAVVTESATEKKTSRTKRARKNGDAKEVKEASSPSGQRVVGELKTKSEKKKPAKSGGSTDSKAQTFVCSTTRVSKTSYNCISTGYDTRLYRLVAIKDSPFIYYTVKFREERPDECVVTSGMMPELSVEEIKLATIQPDSFVNHQETWEVFDILAVCDRKSFILNSYYISLDDWMKDYPALRGLLLGHRFTTMVVIIDREYWEKTDSLSNGENVAYEQMRGMIDDLRYCWRGGLVTYQWYTDAGGQKLAKLATLDCESGSDVGDF